MRIAMVTSRTDCRQTGVDGLARALVQHEHEVVVHARKDAAHLPERECTRHGFEVVHVPAGPARPLSVDAMWSHADQFTRLLRQEFNKTKPDVAHSYGVMAGLAALLAARESALPVVHTHHEPDPEHERVERLICRYATHVVATSSEQVAGLSRMGVPRTQISVVPVGVDLDHHQELAGPTHRRTGRATLLGVGDLRPGHGFDTLVTAMVDVRDAVLVIAAPIEGTDQKTNVEANRLRRLARQRGVEDRVSVTGTATRSEVTAMLRSADIVVAVPRRDTTGLAALEAMACGLPVVASEVGVLADAVVDGITGRLVPPGDAIALAHALRELVTDQAAQEAFGIAAADRVRARYGWDRVVNDALAAYQRAQLVRA